MTSWTDAVPVVLVAVAMLFAPGLLLGSVMGLRLPTALGLAPLLTCAVVALAELVNGTLRVAFSWRLVLVLLVPALVLALVLRRRLGAAPIRADLPGAAVGALALAGGFWMGAVGYERGVAVADEFPQAPDIPYQANHLRWAIETGDVNPFSFSSMGGLGADTLGFYPTLWHGLGTLTAQLTGASVPVVINVLDMAFLAVFTAGAILLGSVVIGQRHSVTAWSAVLSASFIAFPTFLFTWSGVLPNILATALFPAFLALVLLWLRDPDPTDPIPVATRAQARWLLLVALPTMVLAHPNTIFSAGLLVVLAAATQLAGWARRGAGLGPGAGTRVSRASVVRHVAVLVGVPVATALSYQTSVVQAMARYRWPTVTTVPQAVGEAVTNATGTPWVSSVFLPVTVLVLVGLFLAVRTGRAWLVAGYVVWVALYASTQSTDQRALALSGLWYQDRHRIAAFLIVASVPLATLTGVALGDLFVGRLRVLGTALASRARGPASWLGVAAPGLGAALALALFLVASGNGDVESRARVLATTFPVGNDNNRSALITRSEQDFFSTLGRYVPPGQRVINHAWDGSPLIYALSGVAVTSYAITKPLDPRVDYLNVHIDAIATDPKVCDYARQLDARWVVTSGPVEFPQDPAIRFWRGVANVKPSASFRPVARQGQSTLYKITACGWG